jgi:hypothetical protein
MKLLKLCTHLQPLLTHTKQYMKLFSLHFNFKFLDTRCIIVVQTHCISLYTYLLTNMLILRIERTWKTKTHMGF